MKLLENHRLSAVTAYLTDREVSERVISGRVEAFSCKRAGEDKKLSKKLDQQYQEELALSPSSSQFLSMSPLGALSDATSRRLLIDLISTLNASFPDYDFSCLRPDQFTKEASAPFVMRSINSNLADVATQEALTELWSAVDDAVTLDDCDVYSYVPDLETDPFSDNLWSFNYFFFNKALKRIVFFTCVARSKYNYNDLTQQESVDDFRIPNNDNDEDDDFEDSDAFDMDDTNTDVD